MSFRRSQRVPGHEIAVALRRRAGIASKDRHRNESFHLVGTTPRRSSAPFSTSKSETMLSAPQVPTAHTRFLPRILASVLTGTLALGLVFTSGVVAATADAPDLTVTGLQAGGRTNPIGLGLDAPSLSWRSESTGRGIEQTAYEIRVSDGADASSGNAWSTGKVESDQQLNVVYAGSALEDQTRYHWQVRVWDNKGHESDWSADAWFETGLTDFTGDWISAPSDAAQLARWSDYTVTTEFTMNNLATSLYLRAKDQDNGYMWQLSVLSGTPTFRPHKKTNGGYALMAEKPLPSNFTKANLTTGTHTYKVVLSGSTITTSVDDIVIDTRTDTSYASGYVGFRQVKATEGQEDTTFHSMKVTAASGDVLLDTSFDGTKNPFTVGRLAGGDLHFDAPGDGLLNTATNLPLLRTEFTPDAGKTIESARVYAAARGVYELSLNGAKVGDQHLAPGWTNYNKRIQYQTYDVTSQVKQGANALGAYIAPGWYAGRIASFGSGKYGTKPSLIAQLRVDYTDGTSEWVKSGSAWKTAPGPIVTSDLIDGETYDAKAEIPGWDLASFDDAAWSAVGTQPSATAQLVPQIDEPVRQTGEKPALEQTEPATGKHVYDLGQNMVGIASLRLTGNAGDTVTIRYGEVLNRDGTLYTANLRSAKVTDYYTFTTTGTVVYEPRFTYHGFRFVEVSGTSVAPANSDITGLVWGSDLETTGSLTTSNDLLNQLQSNITWGQRGNFLSIPTDTPARDERLGWTGDINVFAQTAAYNSNTLPFLTKWLQDLRDDQSANGDLPGTSPYVTCCGGGIGWSDAGITVPYSIFKAYGDTNVVDESWESMDRFFDYVTDQAGADLIDGRGGYLDWLHLEDPTPAAVLGTAYFAEDARMLGEMAASIGETERAAELAALSTDIRAAFAERFIADDGTVQGNSQTGYAMALGMGMVPAEQVKAVGDKFVAKLTLTGNHLTTGFLGTPWLLPALTASGHNDIAYQMLLHKDYPSWGYEIENGATTIWERWNSIMPNGDFGDVEMNSFNHYAYGAVGTWMYENIGGIAPLEAGYKKIAIAPTPGGSLSSGEGTFDSVYGHISSKWNTTDHGIALDVSVPVGTTADVRIAAANSTAILEGGHLLDSVDGVTKVTAADGYVTVTVGSGDYSFSSDDRGAAVGAIFAAIDDYQGEIDRLAGLGDLTDAQKSSFDSRLDVIRESSGDALTALIGGNDALPALFEASDAAAALRTEVAGADLDDAVRAALLGKQAVVENELGSLTASQLGVSATLSPVTTDPLPGSLVAGAVTVANAGSTPITEISAKVAIEHGWKVDPDQLTRAALAAGATADLAFETEVPVTADNGGVDATLDVSFVASGHTIRLHSGVAWLTVSSPLTISSAVATVDGGEGTLVVAVKNASDTAVSSRIALTVPKGWPAAIASSDFTVAANDERVISVPFIVPTNVTAGSFEIAASLERGDVVLDTAKAPFEVTLSTTPGNATDHVDLGDASSENAHAIQASSSSGTNIEAGLTRRYSNATVPGSWFQYTLAVQPNKPFVLRFIETYDSPATKKYDLIVNGTTVHTRQYSRTETGPGTKVYQVLVPDDGTLTSTGKITVRMQFTTEAGFHDPSIADAWSLPAPANRAPLVSANVSSDAATGTNGWVRGAAEVAVNATDDSAEQPVVEVATGSGDWIDYESPVAVTAQGETTVKYRATDADGLASADRELTVKLDSVAPVTTAKAELSTVAATRDRATVKITATDTTSGVASTSYRIDGGKWAILGEKDPVLTGFGPHEIEYFSTDVAGNAAAPGKQVVVISDVDTLQALVKPTVTGSVKVGAKLKASTGTWNTNGVAFRYQWLRSGVVIAGQTAATYTVRASDSQKSLAVRVTASKAGYASVASTSTAVKAPRFTQLANTSKPKISGTSRVGKTLSASVGKWSVAGASYSYRWYRDGKAITGATKKTYKVASADYKHRLQVKVTAAKTLYVTKSAYSKTTSKVAKKK